MQGRIKQTRSYGAMVDEGTAEPATARCFYGNLVWAVLTLGSVTTFFGTSSGITFVVDDLMEELQLSRSVISFSYAIGTLGGAVMQVPIGRAVDRFGGRRSVAACSAAFYMSLMGMALPHNWYTLTLAFMAMRALGFGGLALACNTCLQQWFVERRGLATGLSECVSTLVGFGICSHLYAMAVKMYGWRSAFLIFGCSLLAYSPLAALLLRSRPEDIGLLPDGRRSAASSSTAASARDSSHHGWRLREAMRTGAFWILIESNALSWGIGESQPPQVAALARA